MLERVACRETNHFGKTAAERAQIVNDIATVEPLLRAGATVEIDAGHTLTEVVAELESIARGS